MMGRIDDDGTRRLSRVVLDGLAQIRRIDIGRTTGTAGKI
jgi:hypothetical protein